jgi:kumamolisin
MQITYTPVQGSERIALPGAVATGRSNPKATIEVSLKLRRKNVLPGLDGRPHDLMTRDELRDTYGASQADIDMVAKILGGFGLNRVDANIATRTIRLRGTVSAMEEAFQVKLFNYSHERGNYRGRVGPVRIPSALNEIVQGVFGLDNRQVARRRRHPVRDHDQARLASVPAAWYVPGELALHYNFPPGDGSGQTVGLLEFGGGFFPQDLKKFCALAKIAVAPNVIPISTDGTPTDSKDGAEGEVMLDIEVVAGICPKANIVVYFAQWGEQGWLSAFDAAVHDQTNNPTVLSVSWGNAEDTDIWTDQAMEQINQTLQDAAMLGVTVCVAAGDDGSSDAISDGHAHVDFPSSSPYALAVGGTTITAKGGAKPDVAWKEGDGLRADNGGSTGGGVSVKFPRPAWQGDVKVESVNPAAILGRCVPDLAANADWNASPYLLVVDGQPQPNGGTSAASPLVASLLTLINAERAKRAAHPVGYLTPVLYQPNGGDGTTIGVIGCTDVLSGENTTDKIGGYLAGPGYDAVSGWGTPNGIKLASAIPMRS